MVGRDIAKRLKQTYDALPEAKKERLLGYAEGVADMQRIQNAEENESKEEEDDA